MGTPGLASGLEKRTGGNTDTALQVDSTEVERSGCHGGSIAGVRPVSAMKASIRPVRCCVFLSRVFTRAVSWSMLRAARLPRPFFRFAHTHSTGLSSGAYVGYWDTVSQ